jgi:hypothetical protein
MIWRALADAVLVAHLGFILFVVLGGLLVLRWPRLAWIHVPVVLWGAAIEFFGWICPLTPLEKWLRVMGGEAGYAGGFIAHYLLPLVYPAGLTRGIQLVLGAFVVSVNLAVYLVLWRRSRRRSGA